MDDGLKMLTFTRRLRAEHVVWIQAGRSDQIRCTDPGDETMSLDTHSDTRIMLNKPLVVRSPSRSLWPRAGLQCVKNDNVRFVIGVV